MAVAVADGLDNATPQPVIEKLWRAAWKHAARAAVSRYRIWRALQSERLLDHFGYFIEFEHGLGHGTPVFAVKGSRPELVESCKVLA